MTVRSLVLCALLTCLACAAPAEETQITVSVSGRPAAARALRVRAVLDATEAPEGRITHDLDRFLLALPRGQTGTLIVRVEALDQAGVTLGLGKAPPLLLTGAERAELAVTLTVPTLTIKVQGGGLVSATVAGAAVLDCGPELAGIPCSGAVPVGATVTLQGRGDESSYLAGWQGPCQGTAAAPFVPGAPEAPCTVALNLSGESAEVTARFLPRVCVADDDRWCWESPLPHGATLRQVVVLRPDLVYAAGHNGALMRFDGTAWETLDRAQLGLAPDDRVTALWGDAATLYLAVVPAGELPLGTVLTFDLRPLRPLTTTALYMLDPQAPQGRLTKLPGSLPFPARIQLNAASRGSTFLTTWVGLDVFPIPALGVWTGVFQGLTPFALPLDIAVPAQGPATVSGVFAFDDSEAFAVGLATTGEGFLLRCVAQSKSCVRVGPSGLPPLYGVHGAVVDGVEVVWAVGKKGVVLRGARDPQGGMTFTRQAQTRTSNTLFAVRALADGSAWISGEAPEASNIIDISSVGQTRQSGTMHRCTSTSCDEPRPVDAGALYALGGDAAAGLWAVGHFGVVLRLSGDTWRRVLPAGRLDDLSGVFGATVEKAPSDLWITSRTPGAPLRARSAGLFADQSSSTSGSLYRLAGLHDPARGVVEQWGSGLQGTLIRSRQRGAFQQQQAPSIFAPHLLDIMVRDVNDVWAVGTRGTVVRFDGYQSQVVRFPVTEESTVLSAVWSSAADEVVVGGAARYEVTPNASKYSEGLLLYGREGRFRTTKKDPNDPKSSEVPLDDLRPDPEPSGFWVTSLWGRGRRVLAGSAYGYLVLCALPDLLLPAPSPVPRCAVQTPKLNGPTGRGPRLWSARPDTTSLGFPILSRIAGGPAAGESYVVGDGGLILRGVLDGQGQLGVFAQQHSGSEATLFSLWAAAGGEAWAVGNGGTLLRRRGPAR